MQTKPLKWHIDLTITYVLLQGFGLRPALSFKRTSKMAKIVLNRPPPPSIDGLAGLPWPEPPQIVNQAHLQLGLHLWSVWEAVLRRRTPQIRWLGRGMEGATRGNAHEFSHFDASHSSTRAPSATKRYESSINQQFDDSYRFEVKLETDNEVRAARVDC
jgi:hypothetical protein